jgi:hypothetical protein
MLDQGVFDFMNLKILNPNSNIYTKIIGMCTFFACPKCSVCPVLQLIQLFNFYINNNKCCFCFTDVLSSKEGRNTAKQVNHDLFNYFRTKTARTPSAAAGAPLATAAGAPSAAAAAAPSSFHFDF